MPPTARVRIPVTDLALLLDLPEEVEIVTSDGTPAPDIELFLAGPPVPDGDARLVYEKDEFEFVALVGIEPVQRDG